MPCSAVSNPPIPGCGRKPSASAQAEREAAEQSGAGDLGPAIGSLLATGTVSYIFNRFEGPKRMSDRAIAQHQLLNVNAANLLNDVPWMGRFWRIAW